MRCIKCHTKISGAGLCVKCISVQIPEACAGCGDRQSYTAFNPIEYTIGCAVSGEDLSGKAFPRNCDLPAGP